MLGVIADDLTGAAEIGAVGLRHGLRADILPGPAFARSRSALPDLLCLDTDSRFCTPTEAARRAAAAARSLRRTGVALIYKKVDSVLRGQVVPEIQAIMAELRLDLALLVPANPSLGRTISDGHYFIHNQPIHKTEFARDPAYPREFSHVLKLLAKPRLSRIQIGDLTEPFPSNGIIVGNVATSRDVEGWARRRATATLVAGGAEFFSAIVKSFSSSISDGPLAKGKRSRYENFKSGFRPGLQSNEHQVPSSSTPSKQLFICGSTSAATREFIAAQRHLGTPLFSLPSELAHGAKLTSSATKGIAGSAAAALHTHPRILLQVGLPLIRRPSLVQKLSSYLVRIAVFILKQAAVDHVFVEGGATAIELVRALHIRRLFVLNELAPGVATLGVEGRKRLRVTMKPGSYQWPESAKHF